MWAVTLVTVQMRVKTVTLRKPEEVNTSMKLTNPTNDSSPSRVASALVNESQIPYSTG